MYQSPFKLWYGAAAIIGYIILLSLPIFACLQFLQKIPPSPYVFTTPLESQTIPVTALSPESYLRIGGGRVQTVAYAPDGQWLLTNSSVHFSEVALYPMQAGRLIYTIDAYHSRVEAVAWSPDGRLIASTGSDGHIFILDMATLPIEGGLE